MHRITSSLKWHMWFTLLLHMGKEAGTSGAGRQVPSDGRMVVRIRPRLRWGKLGSKVGPAVLGPRIILLPCLLCNALKSAATDWPLLQGLRFRPFGRYAPARALIRESRSKNKPFDIGG